MTTCKRCFLQTGADHTPGDCIAALRKEVRFLRLDNDRLSTTLREYQAHPMRFFQGGEIESVASIGVGGNANSGHTWYHVAGTSMHKGLTDECAQCKHDGGSSGSR